MTRDNQQKTLKSKPVKPSDTILGNMAEIMRLINENRQLNKKRGKLWVH